MFTEMSESDLEMEVVLGDDTVVRAVGRNVIGTRPVIEPLKPKM